jgi:dihydropteroate synthase
MLIGKKEFDLENKSYIMGILNVTPDSFSDGGRFIIGKSIITDKVLKTVEQMIADGMDILDVGGESTRPGYVMISDEEEIARTAPVIEAVKKRFDVPISLDTYKSRVARAGIEAGADMVNDIWGFKYSPDMAKLVAETGVAACLMHNRKNTDYGNYMEDVLADLRESLDIAEKAGVPKDKIVTDPGVGFAKSYEQNLEVINKLERLKELGYPVLLGTSRKSVVGLTLDLPSSERLEGTIATTVIGRMKGASIFRVHDVKENKRALLMTDAIIREAKA